MTTQRQRPAPSKNEQKKSDIFVAKEFCYNGNCLFPDYKGKHDILIYGSVVEFDPYYQNELSYYVGFDRIEVGGIDVTDILYTDFNKLGFDPNKKYDNLFPDHLTDSVYREEGLFHRENSRPTPAKITIKQKSYKIDGNILNIEYYECEVQLTNSHTYHSVKDIYINGDCVTGLAILVDREDEGFMAYAYDLATYNNSREIEKQFSTKLFNGIIKEAEKQGKIRIAA